MRYISKLNILFVLAVAAGGIAIWTMFIHANEENTTMKLVLTSSAFEEGKEIPRKYTGEGQDISPPLEWSAMPDNTKEIAIIVDDPDAPTPQPWVHWVIYKISPDTKKLDEAVSIGEKPPVPAGARQGKNTSGKIGYSGPMPPRGHGRHRYYFKIFALDAEIIIKGVPDKDALLNAMKGHILAEGQLMGTYQRD